MNNEFRNLNIYTFSSGFSGSGNSWCFREFLVCSNSFTCFGLLLTDVRRFISMELYSWKLGLNCGFMFKDTQNKY